MVKSPDLKTFLTAGVHFGHSAGRWHPKAAWYIHSERAGVHIINVEKTVEQLSEILPKITEHIAAGKVILFVGTKRQAAEIVKRHAMECGIPYITERWLGGLLTNFDSIKTMLDKYRQMSADQMAGVWEKYTKKERVVFEKDLAKKDRFLSGLKEVKRMPEMVFLVDVRHEKTALTEAQKRKVPVVAIADTNINPEGITYPIPGNDDAVKSIDLLTSLVAEAVKEGMALRAKAPVVDPATAAIPARREVIGSSI